MHVSVRRAAAFAAATLFSGVQAQQCQEVVSGQYRGTPYDNSAPVTHELSEKAFFKIRDPSGQHVCTDDPEADFSFLTYSSLNTTRQRPRNEDLQRAVIVIHGARRDPQNYHAGMIQALQQITDNDEISPDTVSIVAPYFVNDDDEGVGYAAGSRALVWNTDEWAGGSNNVLPASSKTISAFEVLDQIIKYYGDRSRFPNINQIVVSGHSMGAQMAQRYAAVAKTPRQLGISTPVSYYIGDPNSLVWFRTTRPLSTGKCPTYDNYREGWANYDSFGAERAGDMTYNTELVSQGRDALLANYKSKTIAYGRAERDRGDYKGADDCAVYTTGKDRSERFFEFVRAFPPECPDPATNCHTVDLVDSTHDAPTMFRSAAGLARLFRDNWSGDGSRAYDFGYPRWRGGDDPHPDPAHEGEPLIHTDDDGIQYAGGMTDRGCFSDVDDAQSVGSLPQNPYTGSANSRSYCSQQCVDRGFRIAGMSGDYCYCGNALGSQTIRVVSTSCEGTCPGDRSQLCGGDRRLTILATGEL